MDVLKTERMVRSSIRAFVLLPEHFRIIFQNCARQELLRFTVCIYTYDYFSPFEEYVNGRQLMKDRFKCLES